MARTRPTATATTLIHGPRANPSSKQTIWDGGGIDTLSAETQTQDCLSEIENIVLSGSGKFNLKGNGSDNRLVGSASVNVMTGGAGNDVLTGDYGADHFVFNTALNTSTAPSSRRWQAAGPSKRLRS